MSAHTELVEILFGYALVRWILLPCVIGVLIYYTAARLAIGARWVFMTPAQREVERRRRRQPEAGS